MKTVLTWILRILGVLLAALVIALAVAAFTPVPRDELPAVYGAGASSVQPSTTGLLRAFPELNSPTDNPQTPEKVELGRLLFFDPVLSDNNEMSCASCHHPDLGFSDGMQLAQGANGEVERNALSLWNVAYNAHFFWDGRAATLEDQVLVPLEHPNEMQVSDRAGLEAELAAIPAYVELFDAAFPGEAVSILNVQRALAAFERTLISNNSPFDAYAAGQLDALTASQRRGFAIFRSAATRCFECHSAPTFANDTFRITGVADLDGQEHDPGRSAVGDAPDGAFKVPTLRNIVLSAPYMHNGIFSSLEEVIDFYAAGGGRADGVENVDPLIRAFQLTEQEKTDLIAFLYSLTDESNLPEIPREVPSGLPVVSPLRNVERETAAETNANPSGESVGSGSGQQIEVQAGETIQAAVDRARSGDTVLIPYGVYNERVVIDLNDITILGVPNDAGQNPVLDGQGKLTEAVIASGSNFEIGNLTVKNYTDNGIIVEGVTNVHMHHIYAENTGTYGLYPVQSTGVLIEYSEVTGADDAGIYAGQSENVVIRHNIVHGNVLGIEAENTVNTELYGNHAYNNTCGILVVLLPHLTSRVSLDTLVYDNLIEANNHSNFAKEGTAAAIMPPGTGIALIASDNVEVYNNLVKDNNTGGIGIFSLTIAFDKDEIDVGDRPENIYIHSNQMSNNGQQPDPFLAQLGVPGSDILWDVSGAGLRVDQPEEGLKLFPPLLPSSSWSDWAYNMYWNALNFLIGLVS
ncbi:MAG: right-handed parallel beta-helix repeat-containing protein [Anaerolineales bacterium]|nr:right-handed parallel beta-helix repeat-containing protein [Anaerolineales bacterium]